MPSVALITGGSQTDRPRLIFRGPVHGFLHGSILAERGAAMPRAKNEKTDQAQALYRSGWKLADIARELNIPPGTVRRWKCTYKWDEIPEIDSWMRVKARKSKLVCDLIESGWKQAEIAETLGIAPVTVWHWKTDYPRIKEAGAGAQSGPLPDRRNAVKEYNRNYYREKLAYQRLCAIVRNNFQRAALLTFCFQPASPMPWNFVSKFVRSYDGSARLRLLKEYGINYEFVRIAECVSPETGEMRFRYITDLTEEQCKLVAADWIMGEVRIEALSMENLEEALKPIGGQGGFLQKGETCKRRGVSYTRGLKRPMTTPDLPSPPPQGSPESSAHGLPERMPSS